MQWTYDPMSDALSIIFVPNKKSSRTVREGPWVLFDYDSEGNTIALEVLSASKHLPQGALSSLPLSGETYSLVEAARRIGLDPATLRQQILRKRIRATKYYRQWWVDQSALDEYLASRAPQGRRSRKKSLASR